MGGGVSTLPCVVEEHPYLLERFHERYAEIFLDLHHDFKAVTPAMSDKIMREIIVEKLKAHEMDIIHAIVKEEAHSKSHNQLMERFQSLNLGNGNGRGGIHSLNFLCCVDGSQQSVIAFENLLTFSEKIHTVQLFHAFHALERHQLNMRPEVVDDGGEVTIQSFYERRLDEILSPTSYSFSFHERFDRTPFHVLSDLLEPASVESKDDQKNLIPLVQPDFIFLGYPERQAEFSSSSYLTLLGSTADIALRSIHFPCIICKRSPSVASSSRFPGSIVKKSCVMMINFSKNSKSGLMMLLPLLSPQDSLRVVYFAKPDVSQKSIDTLTSYYQAQLDSYGPSSSEIKIISISSDEKVEERIVEYCNERTQRGSWREDEEVDFLAIAPREKLLIARPLTEYVLEHVRCNIILCKG